MLSTEYHFVVLKWRWSHIKCPKALSNTHIKSSIQRSFLRFFFLSRFHSCRTPLNSVIGHSDRSIKYRCLVNGRNQANAQLNQPKFHAIQWHIHHATYLSVISETNIFSFNSPAFLMCVYCELHEMNRWAEHWWRRALGQVKEHFVPFDGFFFWSFQFIFLQFCWAVWLLLIHLNFDPEPNRIRMPKGW